MGLVRPEALRGARAALAARPRRRRSRRCPTRSGRDASPSCAPWARSRSSPPSRTSSRRSRPAARRASRSRSSGTSATWLRRSRSASRSCLSCPAVRSTPAGAIDLALRPRRRSRSSPRSRSSSGSGHPHEGRDRDGRARARALRRGSVGPAPRMGRPPALPVPVDCGRSARGAGRGGAPDSSPSATTSRAATRT